MQRQMSDTAILNTFHWLFSLTSGFAIKIRIHVQSSKQGFPVTANIHFGAFSYHFPDQLPE